MRRIEETTFYPLSNLMLGKPFLFDTLNQRLVATLLCLASMHLGKTSGEVSAIPASDIDYLTTNFQPPDTWKVWVTHFEHEHPDLYWNGYFGMQRKALSDPTPIGAENCNE